MFGSLYWAQGYFGQGYGAIIPHGHPVLHLTVYARRETSLVLGAMSSELAVLASRVTRLDVLGAPIVNIDALASTETLLSILALPTEES